jgi:PAS domain S-box-containing protein
MSAEAAVFELELSELFRHAQDGVFIIDRQRRVVLFSPGCERIVGAHHTLVLGAECACYRLTDCRDDRNRSLGTPALCPAVRIFHGQADHVRQRMNVRHRDGRRVWVETVYSPIKDQDGRVTAVIGVMRDITEAKQQEDELRSTAEHHGDDDARAPAGVSPRELIIGERDVAGSTDETSPLDHLLTTIEKREILSALERAKGQRTLAAQILGISRSRLYRRMGALGLLPLEEGSTDAVETNASATPG